jgi:protein TonB
MAQYSVAYFGSKAAVASAAGLPSVGPAGPRPLAGSVVTRHARTNWALLASSVMHVCIAVVLVLIVRPAPSLDQPVAEAIELVFTPPQAAGPANAQPTSEVAPETDAPTQQAPAEAEPPVDSPPVAELSIPDPDPPPPVDLAPLPQRRTPPPLPKPSQPPPPRPAVRPRPTTVGPAPEAPAQARPAASAPPGPARMDEAPPAAISPGWQAALAAWLQANKVYPEEARRRGDEGRAAVRFTVTREGRVVGLQLLSSTGSVVLDAAVDRLLRGARLPPFPAGMSQEEVTVTLQIRYSLER